ncbi:MAG TPA: alpha/beta fold hydrolase [Lachnospiraceae bacterium]|nr:alpha/beta fold hydrolase [Lachnospiraceae bacterium]
MVNVEITRDYPISCKCNLSREMKDVVIACHGFMGAKDIPMFDLLSDGLKEKGFICFDFPGHGMSQVSGEKLTLENCLNDISAVYQHVRTAAPNADISVFGTSMGADLILMWRSEQKYDIKKIVCKSAAIDLRNVLENIIGIKMDEFKETCKLVVGHNRKIQVPYEFYDDIIKRDICQEFNPGKTNYLFIHGVEDRKTPISNAKKFCNMFNLNLIEINGAEHSFNKVGELERVVKLAIDFYKN